MIIAPFLFAKIMNIEDKKALSLNQTSLEDRISDAARAFYTQHPDAHDAVYWTVETFDDHLIIEEGRKFFRVAYTVSDGAFTFDDRDDWPQVSTEWTLISNVSDMKSTMPTPTTTPKPATIKMLNQNRVGGYAVLWGDENERDLDGEWFDSGTEELDGIFKSVGKLPYLYNHAMDGSLKTSVIGLIDVMDEDDIGLWYEAQLDAANKYTGAFLSLVKADALGTSSGTLSGAVSIAKSGRIERWPIVEISATPTPADPRQRSEHPVNEMKSIFKSVGLEFDYMADDAKADDPEAGRTPADTVAENAKRLSIEVELMELEL